MYVADMIAWLGNRSRDVSPLCRLPLLMKGRKPPNQAPMRAQSQTMLLESLGVAFEFMLNPCKQALLKFVILRKT